MAGACEPGGHIELEGGELLHARDATARQGAEHGGRRCRHARAHRLGVLVDADGDRLGDLGGLVESTPA